jgi:hypothetical protein
MHKFGVREVDTQQHLPCEDDMGVVMRDITADPDSL